MSYGKFPAQTRVLTHKHYKEQLQILSSIFVQVSNEKFIKATFVSVTLCVCIPSGPEIT